MNNLLIKNASVVLYDKTVAADVLISGGKIKKNEKDIEVEPKQTDIIDAKGLYVLAGIFDMHVHLREPGFEYKEDILSGCRAAVKGGVTALACMPNTAPVIDNAALVGFVRAKAADADLCKVYPIGCVTKGQRGKELAEFGLMKKAGAVALSDDGRPVENAFVMRLALEYARDFGLTVISHAEETSLSCGDANEGYSATVSGLRGISRAAEEVMIARDIVLAQTLGTKIHIAHISTKGSVQLIREAKARGVAVTCETCPHYFCLTDDGVLSYDTNFKVNPPLREKGDVEAIIGGIKDGTVDAIVTDHAPHHTDDKNVEFAKASSGISGLETLFCLCYTALVKSGAITLNKLSQLLTKNPKKILGLEDGGIKAGFAADLTIVDINKKHRISKLGFVSKGKNTPFDGAEVFGEVRYTIVDGVIKYKT